MAYVKREELDEEDFEKKVEFFKKTGQTHTLLYGSVFINGKQYTSDFQKLSNHLINSEDVESSLEFIKQIIVIDLKEKVNMDVFKKKI